jgi:hypothetical protein
VQQKICALLRNFDANHDANVITLLLSVACEVALHAVSFPTSAMMTSRNRLTNDFNLVEWITASKGL